ncbi:ATP-grasp fold amidoligase family protein [Glutamicibacter sp.]|uniref:ATP-grasp fold amidoligase family protein n=1 Tax=Glutamicibacter sp. TaxID=1931995 RepID=UPI0028BDAC3C|nr:ATP-grasp fold amidoligase family protein [Glutamicibacter sp.]
MSYKKRIKSKILYLLKLEKHLKKWDDERYLKLIYFIRMEKRLNLEPPKSFNEKIQWLKINDRKSIYTTLVDKHAVKAWVSRSIGEDHIIPTLGVWDTFEEIDFDLLPDQFVLKCTHDSGGLIVCEDRDSFDIEAAKAKIKRSMAKNYFYLGREWPYKNVKPRIIAETYFPSWIPTGNSRIDGIEDLQNKSKQQIADFAHPQGLIDYKFYCFHGEPKFLSVSQGPVGPQPGARDFLNLNWTETDFEGPGFPSFSTRPPKPAHYDEMIRIARQLSAGIPFVRVDLYEHLGCVLFSEMTLSPASGMVWLEPASANLELGDLIDLSEVGHDKTK